MLMFSRPCSYAIRALTYLATQPPGKLSGAKEISEHENIPPSFLSKVLLQLRRGRLVRSYKGIGGGYELAQPPDKISLFAVIACMEGENSFNKCILEDHDCATQGECLLHAPWGRFRDELRQFLEHNTLAVMIRQQEGEAPLGLGASEVVQLRGLMEPQG